MTRQDHVTDIDRSFLRIQLDRLSSTVINKRASIAATRTKVATLEQYQQDHCASTEDLSACNVARVKQLEASTRVQQLELVVRNLEASRGAAEAFLRRENTAVTPPPESAATAGDGEGGVSALAVFLIVAACVVVVVVATISVCTK